MNGRHQRLWVSRNCSFKFGGLDPERDFVTGPSLALQVLQGIKSMHVGVALATAGSIMLKPQGALVCFVLLCVAYMQRGLASL